MPSKHLILCRPLLLPSIFPSIRVFSSKPVLRIRWPKYWSFSSSISLSSGLISFRMDWLDLLAVQRTLKYHSSKASILQGSAFFMVQFSHPYVTTGKSLSVSSVQSLSCVQLFATPWTIARQASLSITNSQSSPKLTSIESVMPSSHLILW